MPNKTIYVSDEDMPLFERAQNVASGSLSAAIARALRRFVEEEEARMEGFEDVTVKVGKVGAHNRKRFLGRPLARWVHRSGGEQAEIFTVYRTRKGHYAVHLEKALDWTQWVNPEMWMHPERWTRLASQASEWCRSHGHHSYWQGPWSKGGWAQGYESGSECTLDVYNNLEDLRKNVPSELVDLVEESEHGPEVERLDI